MTARQQSIKTATSRVPRKCDVPMNEQGKHLKVSQYFGENVYNYHLSKSLSMEDKDTLSQVIAGKKNCH